jgi:hypothetical protein
MALKFGPTTRKIKLPANTLSGTSFTSTHSYPFPPPVTTLVQQLSDIPQGNCHFIFLFVIGRSDWAADEAGIELPARKSLPLTVPRKNVNNYQRKQVATFHIA